MAKKKALVFGVTHVPGIMRETIPTGDKFYPLMAGLNTFNAELDLLLPLETVIQPPTAAAKKKPTQMLECLKKLKYLSQQPNNNENNCKNKCYIDQPAQRRESK